MHEMSRRFKEVLKSYPKHGMPDILLLQCFYRGLCPDNSSILVKLFSSGLIQKHPKAIDQILDEII